MACDICNGITKLDISSCDKLFSYIQEILKKPTKFLEEQDAYSEKREFSEYQSGVKKCKDHPEEEVMYFCFDCERSVICSECVVHGLHRNHRVQTIKNAFPTVLNKVHQEMQEVKAKLKELQAIKDNLIKGQEKVLSYGAAIKEGVAKAFEELHEIVQQKLNITLREIDKMVSEGLGTLDEELQDASMKLVEWKSTEDFLSSQIKSLDKVYIGRNC